MERIDRRAFLATGIKTGVVLAAGGFTAGVAAGAVGPSGTLTAAHPDPHGSGPGRPQGLTTTGATGAVGVDPDTVQFAWRLTDSRRGAHQTGYRIVVTGTDGGGTTVWDSGPVATRQQAFVPYGGPPLRPATRYRWTVRTADGSGQWSGAAAPTVFTTGLREPDWSALWLRPGPPVPGLEEYTYLRATPSLPPGRISHATAFVAAAHRYQLWVNGARIDTGPSFCFPDEQYYQATDITPGLVAGRPNAVGILHHWYGPGRGRPTSAPGVVVQVVVHYRDGATVTVGTDGTWRTRRAEWLPAPQRNNDAGDFVEWIDARRSPLGWAEATYDDAGWSPATVLGPVGTPPFTALYAQRTRITETAVPPVSVRTLSTGSVVVDFGKVYAGRPLVTFDHGVAGQTVPMHVGYTLDPDGSVSTTHNTQGTDLSFSYVQRDGGQTFDPYWYLGFRYLQVDGPGEPLRADQVWLAARHATMPDQSAATFTSSDPMLDAVWGMCAHSALYTSQEQFIDTPTREKGQFLWDACNESQVVMWTRGEQNLTWQGLRDQARAQARYWATTGEVNEVYPNDDGPQDYPRFTALYPEWVWRYYLATGDRATVVGLLPTLLRVGQSLTGTVDPSTGLISNQPLSLNGDSTYGYDYETVADTTLNILAVNAFRRIAQVAALAGQEGAALQAAGQADTLAAAVNGRLVTGEQRYADGLLADGSPSTHSSQLANAAALAYGVAPAGMVGSVADYVASLDISVEPDHGMEVLRALHAGGRPADVVRLLTDASFPGWAAIIRAGGTFTWETWTPSDVIGDSMSHGWGSSALVAVQEALLGVVPTAPAPGGPPTLVTVTPPDAGLTFASGTYPTPAGSLAVSWHSRGGGGGLSVTVPPNAGARCRLRAAASEVREGGLPLARAAGVEVVATGPSSVDVLVGAGRYDFTIG